LQPTSPSDKKPAWWLTAIQFLGLPAAVIAIVMQSGQTAQVFQSKDKTLAEVHKTEAEAQKTQAETEQLRLDLKEKEAKLASQKVSGAAQNVAQLDATINSIRATLSSIDVVSRKLRYERAELLLSKYVVLWAAIWAVGIVFDIFTQLWNLVSSSIVASIFTRPYSDSRRREKLVRRLSIVLPVLNQLPHFLRWAFQLSILVALVGPLFDSLAAFNGSSVTLRSVFNSILTAHFSTAVAKIARAVGT
jgi:hypothetical protein